MNRMNAGRNKIVYDGTSGDSTQLIYLRARWYNPADGRFQSRDTWSGNAKRPITYNVWLYTNDSTAKRVVPSSKPKKFNIISACSEKTPNTNSPH
jgi:RHS repeat-associated protein